ncbi:MAG: hypothetical protein M3Y35_19080 [Actinomycetota bacterium]|nr:hypothetical protein [Actinomycetota bacterium]
MTEVGGAGIGAAAELEARYRRVLRVFPGQYRRDREEEVVGVLLAAAAAGQSRPSWGEKVSLLVQAGRVWVRTAVSPDPVGNHRAGSVLSVLLPLVLLYPVARTALSAITLPWSFLVTNHPDQGAWALWGLTAIAVVVGPAALPRWLAAAGTVWFGGVLAWGAVTGQTGIVSAGFGYFAIQVTAWCLLADPHRVRTGRRLLRPYWWASFAALAIIIALIGAPGMPDLFIGGVFWPLAVLSVTMIGVTIACLRNPTGRALVTVCGTLFAAFVAGHGWWTGIGSAGFFLPSSNRPDTATMVWLLGLPLVTWAALRAISSAVARRHLRAG